MKIQLKRSRLEGPTGGAKEPTPEQMEYGELAVNYYNGDPAIFLKNDANNIIRIAGSNSVGTADNLQEVCAQGNTTTTSIKLTRANNPSTSDDGKDGIIVNNTNDANGSATEFLFQGQASGSNKFTIASNGNTSIDGTLNVNGDTTVVKITANDVAQFNANLTVGGGDANGVALPKVLITEQAGSISASGDLAIGGSSQFDGDVQIGGGATNDGTVLPGINFFEATGNAEIGGTLDVAGTSTLADVDSTTLDTTGAVAVGTTLGVSGNTTLGGTVGITGDTTIATNKIVFTASTGDATFTGTITPNGYSFASLAALP